MKVWISYVQEDREFVDRFRTDLAKLDIDVLVADEIVRPGESWIEGISKAILATDMMLLVLSSKSIDSKWMTSEIAFAVSAKSMGRVKQIIPIVIERDLTLPPFISDMRYLDCSDDRNYKLNLEVLRNLQIASSVTPSSPIDSRGIREANELKLSFLQAQRDLIQLEQISLDIKRADITKRITYVYALVGAIGSLLIGIFTISVSVGFTNAAITLVSFISGILASVFSYLTFSAYRLRKEGEK